MRIVQVCPYSWDSPGGVQVHVRRLTHQLSQRGHEVMVLAPGLENPADGSARIIGRPFRVPFNGSIVPLCFSRRSALQIAKALDGFKPDIVHVHEPFAPSVSMLATWQARSPVVATFHAYADSARLLRVASPLLRLVSRRIDVRIAVSAAAAAYAAHGPDADFELVPNGTDVQMFEGVTPAPLPPGRKILFVNRLDPRKGFRGLIRAFATLADHYPDVLLVVAGAGQDAASVRTLRPDIRDRVVMLGTLPHHLIAPYFAAANVFVAPATGGESFGIVLLEAMAAGVPIVASDIAGYREVVRHDQEGLLVAAGDDGRLGTAIGRLLDDPALAARLSSHGRSRVREFSWETLAVRIEALYETAAAGHPKYVAAGLERGTLSSLPSAAAPRK